MAEAITCPKCGTPLGFNVVAKLKEESRLQFKLSPAPNEMLSAKNVGGAIEQMATLLKSCARDQKVTVEVLVDRIETNEDGEITVGMLIARAPEHNHGRRKRQARFAAARGEKP